MADELSQARLERFLLLVRFQLSFHFICRLFLVHRLLELVLEHLPLCSPDAYIAHVLVEIVVVFGRTRLVMGINRGRHDAIDS
ncbi:hypothetical protein D9M69_586940 [compost metagenome]